MGEKVPPPSRHESLARYGKKSCASPGLFLSLTSTNCPPISPLTMTTTVTVARERERPLRRHRLLDCPHKFFRPIPATVTAFRPPLGLSRYLIAASKQNERFRQMQSQAPPPHNFHSVYPRPTNSSLVLKFATESIASLIVIEPVFMFTKSLCLLRQS